MLDLFVIPVFANTMIIRQISKIFGAVAALLFFTQQGLLAQEASVLASGQWYKLATTQAGVYQISGADLQQQGIAISQIKPDELQLYGYGGGMLPQPISQPRHTDLPEQAIQLVGGEDDRFDAQDYILFFAESPDQLTYLSDNGQHALSYQKNLYSDTTFYFLTFGQKSGKRVAVQENIQPANQTFTSFDDFAVHEQDLVNVLAKRIATGSGREWFGEVLNNGQNVSVDFETTGMLPDTDVQVVASVLGTATTTSAFDVAINGQNLGTINVAPLQSGQYDDKGRMVSDTFSIRSNQLNTGKASMTVSYQSGSNEAGYLDKLLLQFPRKLALYNDQTTFRKTASAQTSIAGYRVDAAGKDVAIWDITDPYNIKEQKFAYDGTLAVFGAQTDGQLKKYIIFDKENLLKPDWQGQIPNQNIKQSIPDLVIITYPGFMTEADRLANFRREHDQLNVQVVTTTQVYNEFSSGAQDVSAIRNYLKYLHDRQPGKLKNVLLFGKGSYDYKDRVAQNTNYVPTYESRNSVNPIYSYSSDDYYGFLEDDEGYWDESYTGDHTLDIGVGRLPVKNLKEAAAVVDKLIYYSTSPSTFGQWKSKVLFVADDGDRNQHQRDADQLATFVDTAYSVFNTDKIYVDAFEQESIPTGELAPKVSNAIQEAIKKGAFIINYTGHGSESQWAHESILTLGMINQWKNIDQLPFFVTATCEFGRQDVPGTISGAERLVLNPDGGAIGIVTTARPVFSSTNLLINKAFYKHIFEQVEGHYQTIGEVFQKTKNDGLSGRVNRNFSLLGDPSMRLAYPQDRVTIDSVLVKNPDGTYSPTDTLKALAQVRLTGSITQYADQLTNTNFNGLLYLSVYDKPTTTSTLGNGSEVMQFSERKNVIHRGKARVSNGLFEIEFVVPKNIVYKNGEGKISLYAVQSEGPMLEAQGASVDIQIGGSIAPVPIDNEAPLISLFMDDTTFVNGGVTAANTVLIAHLSDESGINISSNGLGQDIQAVLIKKGQDSGGQVLALNDFYSANVETYQEGSLVYPIQNLEDGEYMLTLHAWDNMNNKAEKNIEFFVQSGEVFIVNSFYNAPNPMSQSTSFLIDHNRQGDDLQVVILMMNMQGQMVFRYVQQLENVPTRIQNIEWKGRDAYGNLLKPGVYLAKLLLKSLTDGNQVEKNHKIIITN